MAVKCKKSLCGLTIMNFVKVKDRNRERDKKKEKLLLIRRENGVENDAMRDSYFSAAD